MALQLRRDSSVKVRIITTLMMVFSLVAQPLYGFVSNNIAFAATYPTSIVTGTSSAAPTGWTHGSTQSGGSRDYVADSAAPLGKGALKLTTTETTASKSQLSKSVANVRLDSIGDLKYYTKYIAGAPTAAVAYQLTIKNLTGSPFGSTNLVYEPYWNGTVDTSGAWQEWSVSEGKFWSSSTVGGLTNGAGGPPLYTLQQVLALNPNATVSALLLNIGTYNVNYNVLADAVQFNGMVYDFEPAVPATPTNLRFNDTGACGGATNVNYVTPKWNAVAGAASYEYKVNLPGGGEYGPVNVGNVTSLSGPFGAEGTSAFSVRAVGANGLTSEWAQYCAVTYDATSPAKVTLTTPIDSSYQDVNDFYFKWNGVTGDTGSTVHYEFQSSQSASKDADGVLNSGVWKNTDSTSPEQKYLDQPQIHSTGANGTWYWQARAVDAAGNVGQWSDVWKMTIDMQAPVLTTSIVDNAKMQGTANLDLHAAEQNPKVYNIRVLNLDGTVAKFKNGTPVPGYYNANSSVSDVAYAWDTTQMNEGVYRIQFSARDAAGNAAVSLFRNVIVDNTLPTATLSFPAPGPAATSFSVQFSEAVNVADAENAANYLLNNWKPEWSYASLTGHATASYNATTKVATVSFTDPGWYVSGEQQWGVKNVRDLAGNAISETRAYSTTPAGPTAPGVPTAATPTTSKTINWTWGASTDPGEYSAGDAPNGSIEYHYFLTDDSGEVIGKQVTSALSATTVVADDGNYVLHVWAVDIAGNAGSVQLSAPVVVDTEAPLLTINSPVQNLDGTYRVSGTTTDVSRPVTVKVNGIIIDDQVVADTDGTWMVGLGALNANTTYAITADTNDAAGNVAQQKNLNFTTPAVAVIPLTNVSGTLAPLSQARVVAVNNNGNANQPQDATTGQDAAVLGTQTTNEKGDASDISKNVAAITPSANGWQLFNLAWYWWLLILGAIVGAIWWIAARRQNAQ